MNTVTLFASSHIPRDIWRHIRLFVSDPQTVLSLRLVCRSSIFPPLSHQKQHAFQSVVVCGDVTILLQLLETFELTSSDARASDNLALQTAAQGGHVPMLQCLKNEFGLTDVDARSRDNVALRWAAANGHVEVLQCLKNDFGLTDADARACNNNALLWANLHGHVTVAQCLKMWQMYQK